MNKKFSTLMLGMLLTSAFASAQTIDYSKLQIVDFEGGNVAAGTYFLVQSTDDKIDDTDRILSVVKNGETLTYGASWVKSTSLEESAYQWTVEIKEGVGTYHYALKNAEAGTYLTFPIAGADDSAPVTDVKSSGKAEYGTTNTSYFSVANDAKTPWKNGNQNLIPYGTYKYLYFQNVQGGAVAMSATGNTSGYIFLCEYESNNLTYVEGAATLNDVKGGEGFNLKFSVDNKKEWSNDILTDLNLKAFYVHGNGTDNSITIDAANHLSIPAGIYLASEYPASLSGVNEITKKDDFYACTFVAVDPDKNYGIHQANSDGVGFELTTVVGSAMNLYHVQGADDKSENLSEKGEIFVGNACFEVSEPDPLNGKGEYTFRLNDFRHLKDLSDATKTEHTSTTTGLYLGYVEDQYKNYLITAKEGLKFTTTNSTLYDVTKLLKSEDAPSIYTMQFVSEINKASEKGQYLTVGLNDAGNAFALSAVEDMDDMDPMFQFVITAIDKENKTVTFTNRQTKMPVTVSLYENEDGSFTVYSGETLRVSTVDGTTTNGVVDFKDGTLQATKVVLTPITVEDKFATFVNRAEGAGLVTFELAKNIDDTPAFYVGIEKENGEVKYDGGKLYAYANEAVQFELVKNKKTNGEDVITPIVNKYVYLNGDRIINSTKRDTVAYNTYKIKAFTGDNQSWWITSNAGSFYLDDNNSHDFAIKTNVDGSVSLIPVTSNPVEYKLVNYLYVKEDLKLDTPSAAWEPKSNYNLSSKLSEGLKTFMVEEDPTLSYEAVPQHVSFEAVRGGFLTKDENSDARLAIATAASEDLTFWLDTVHSDYTIPSFYIMKNGAFMYNAADSADYYNDRSNYRFNLENKKYDDGEEVAKLIFKAGELVTSDTIRTTVNGQSVLVAEKDNAPKNIKGGLHNFHFQIIRAEEGSDEYVIRQDNNYVCQYNNYFYLNPDKDQAYRFVIEKQAAPTANEGIEVSEVKVIAGNGQITIMGAAGKKVVVSNILGKVVASQTISSDNATIAVPAGIVAVAVEGEAAVKAVVK